MENFPQGDIGKSRDKIGEEIGEKLGWSRDKVAQHNKILENVVTEILETARNHQEGRVTTDCDNCHNFTEGWFRNSGLYEFSEDDESEDETETREALF